MTLERINPNNTITDIDPVQITSPYQSNWFLTTSVYGVSEEALPWMLAQGWTISGTVTDKTVYPWVVTYSMVRTVVQNYNILHKLLEELTTAYNDGRKANDTRYDDIVALWGEVLDKSQTHLAAAETELDGYVTIALSTLASLQEDYDAFYAATKATFDGIDLTGEADEARINEQWDGEKAKQHQAILDRGFYSSELISAIDARIERERALALTDLSEKLMRLTVDVKAKQASIYADVLKARMGLVSAKLGIEDKQQELLRYQLDERNKLLVGLFGFMERRTDSYPDLGMMAQLASALGEGGLVTP